MIHIIILLCIFNTLTTQVYVHSIATFIINHIIQVANRTPPPSPAPHATCAFFSSAWPRWWGKGGRDSRQQTKSNFLSALLGYRGVGRILSCPCGDSVSIVAPFSFCGWLSLSWLPLSLFLGTSLCVFRVVWSLKFLFYMVQQNYKKCEFEKFLDLRNILWSWSWLSIITLNVKFLPLSYLRNVLIENRLFLTFRRYITVICDQEL